jgi:TetR/AcrR family transcriptional regulator, transcriptional repressor for nem operon
VKHFSEISASAERVVDVAQDLVQRHGYNGFSYDDISQKIGIKKPSIHHHFATKSELVTVVAQRYTHRFREHLLSIEGKHTRAGERLAAYAALFEATYAENRRLCVCGMLGAEAEGLPDEVVREVHRFFRLNLEWLSIVMQDGLAAGQLRFQAAAPAQAQLFLCALEGAMVVGRGLGSDSGPSTIAQAMLSSMQA